jgi:hypothetical protein
VRRIRRARGYFPKELPPAFCTEAFAAYESTKTGRAALDDYKAAEGFTDASGSTLRFPAWRGGLADVEELQEAAHEVRVAVLEEPSNLQRRPVPSDQSECPPTKSRP